MPVNHPLCGLRPRSHGASARIPRRDATLLPANTNLSVTVIQAIPVVHNQEGKGSCVGQSTVSIVEYCYYQKYKVVIRASGVGVWIDARRRQGNIEGVHDGTSSEYAIDSLTYRGYSPYVPDEDNQPLKSDAQLQELDSELAAFDTPHSEVAVQHYAIWLSRKALVVEALQSGYGVMFGTGVLDPYFAPPKDGTVLGTECLAGYINYNGHEQRIFAWFPELNAFGVLNSWGEDWCEFTYGGVTYKGCCLVSPDVIEEAWDVDALRIEFP